MNLKINIIRPIACFSILLTLISCQTGRKKQYQGTPFNDSKYTDGAQKIPGKLECEFYDLGGEGVAYHDVDSINSGSGRYNPPNGTYLHAFRENESVDISYTKFRDEKFDNNPYNFVNPEWDQLYIGWTEPGEWTKYTIDVQQTGRYRLGLMYTANKEGQISIAINDKDATGLITVPTTYVAEDTVAWRQWHHWNYLDGMTELSLKKGWQTITLHSESGGLNYEHINFELISKD